MNRVWTLSGFYLRRLLGSPVIVAPVSIAAVFAIIGFEYGMDQAQFTTVAGLVTAILCLLAVLLLAGKANRGSSYLLLSRLHNRVELLAALLLAGLFITTLLAFLIAVPNLLAGRLSLEFASVAWLLPTWLALWLLAASLALSLSDLAARSGSNLLGYALLAALLVASDQQATLEARGLGLLSQAVALIVWPISTMLSRASAGLHDATYFLALGGTLVSAGFFFLLAAKLFDSKDLLWTE